MKEIKIRYSKQRELIFNNLKHRYDHPTAEMIYQDLKVDYHHLSLGTVYRNLNELVELGKILRINVPGDSDRFDKMLVKHSHFFCEKCKSILDINEINLNDVVNEIEINNNIKILSNQISLYGICSKCQEKK